jgi:hypothetical protein
MEKPKPGIEHRRDEDFFSGYANNIYVEPSIWDLKIIFGQTDLSAGPQVVVQHTAITLPWNYVKILSYVLRTNLAAREAEDGRIPVPSHVLVPPPKEIPPDENFGLLKHPKEGLEAVQKIWDEFVKENPELQH